MAAQIRYADIRDARKIIADATAAADGTVDREHDDVYNPANCLSLIQKMSEINPLEELVIGLRSALNVLVEDHSVIDPGYFLERANYALNHIAIANVVGLRVCLRVASRCDQYTR